MVSFTKYYRFYKTRFQIYSRNHKNRVLGITTLTILCLFFISSIFSGSSHSLKKNIIKSNYTSWLKDISLSPSDNKTTTDLPVGGIISDSPQESASIQRINYFKTIFQIFEQYQPQNKLTEFTFDSNAFNQNDQILSSDFLSKIGRFPPNFVNDLKTTHSEFVKAIPEYDPDLLHYSGDGVVFFGGGDTTWLSLIATRMFRKMGGTLSVEVVLPKFNDYLKDREICDTYLPQLNAKCIVATEQLGIARGQEETLFYEEFGIRESTMQRSLAILTSSFENAIVLSGDSILLKPLDEDFFYKEPFSKYGMINWQDFTRRYTSPFFYQVSETKVEGSRVRDGPFPLPESRQVSSRKADEHFALHDRKGAIPDKTSDGGLMVISKSRHWKTLILASFYNLNGNACFYQFLSQKASNAEKETFAAAATALELPYYNVNTNVEANGFWYNNEYRGVGMLQFDPIIDHYAVEEFIEKYKDASPETLTDGNFVNFVSDSSEKKSALFFRVNYPRLLPLDLIKDKFIVKENGDRIRMFSDAKYFTGDLENSVWRVMNDYICHLDLKCSYLSKHFSDERKSKAVREKFCSEEMKQHLLWLTGGR